MIGEDQVTSKRDKLKDIQFTLKDKHNRHIQMIEFLENNDECPTCEQDIDEAFKTKAITQRTEQSKELSDGLKKLSDEMTRVTDKIKEYKKKFETSSILKNSRSKSKDRSSGYELSHEE